MSTCLQLGYAAPLDLTTEVNPVRISATYLSLILALGSASAVAADPPAQSAATTPPVQGQATPNADNTGINVRDRDGATQTPQKQTTGVDDRELVAAVRRAVVDDKSLSTSAHNVKIVANNGVVTLRGPVRSNDERAKVEKLAQQVTGVSSVENQLDIKTANSN
jgi:osmotically-inducible protein OsmY